MPTSCKSEGDILNEISEGNVTSGYVTPTGAEACDVKIPLEEAIVSMASTECVSVFDIPRVQASKNADGNKMSSKSAKMAEAVLTQKPVSASHPVDLTVSSVPAQNKLEEGRVTSRQSYVGVKLDNQDAEPTKTSDSFRRNANETPVVSDTVCDMLKSLPEQATMEQVKHYFTQLSEFSNRLVEWENRLKSWEVQLQAKAETLYWRDRCFQSEMATKPSPNHVYLSEKACSPGAQVLNSSSTSSSINALASAVRSQSSSTTDVASGSSLSSSNSSSVVIQNGTPGGMVSSELRQRLTQMRVQSGSRVPVSHINTSTTTSGNQSGAAPSSLASLSKNRQPIIIEKVSGVQASSVDQHFLSRQQVACDAALTCGSQQAVPIVSLLGSGKALPMIFPVLGGSQPIVFLSPQMLSVPMTSAPVTLLQTPAGKSEVNVVSEPRQKTLPRLTFSVDSIDSVQNKPERSNLLNQKSDVEANVCAGVNSSRIVAKDIILASGAPLQSDIVAPPAVTLAVLQNPKEFQPCVVNGKTNDSDLENREISNDKSRSSDELAVASNQPISNDVVLSDGVQPSHSENSEQLQSNHENLVIHVNLNGRDVLTPVTGESDQIASGEKSSTVAVSLSEAIKGGNLAVAEHAMAVKTEKMAPHPGHQSLMDFTKWLHERMQNVYKEKESHGNILGDGSDSQIVLYTRTNAAPDLSDAKLLERKAAPCEILAEKVVRTGNESLVSSSDFEMDSDVSASPQVTPQVPLVVENENDFLRDDIADEEEPSPKEKLGLGRRKKRMGEKTHALKKVRMDV